jgi:hypothetical protein
MVRWVQNNATLASQAAGGSSFDTVQAIPLPGEFTYARAEVLRASGSPRGITQPLFFRDVAGLPADMSFSVDRTTTTDSIHYNRDDIQGIASATWDETNSSLALTLTNPSGSLVELRLAAGLSTPAALDNDGQSIAASGTLEGYQSSPDSAWFFDAAQGVLYFKVRHAANSAQVQVGFGTGSATPTPTASPIILAPAADANVDSTRAGTNYGSSVSLRTDALPEQRSYLRFAVPGDAGPITGATLRVYANTASVTGYRASRTEGGWTENDINYNNKPATIGTPVGTSGSVASNTWTQVNVLDALLAAGGSGELNLMLDTTSSTAVRYDSREGPNAPQLVIQSTGQNTPEPPTATPTPEAAATLTFAPVEDAYVSDSAPDARYGAAANLRVDTTAPVQRSYLRFDVQGIVGTVTRATLRVFAASGSSQGYEVRTLSGSWSEAAVAYNTALGIGASAAGVSNKPITTGSWTAVDVTSLVAGNGLLDLALTGISSTAINFNSREGANPPQLVVEFGGSGRTSETAHEASPVAFSLPPDSLDSDGDGAPDAVELLNDSNPAMFDTDGDSLLDLWEIESGLSPADAEDRDGAQGDPDGDGISNLEEQRNGTDPLNPGDRSALPLFLPFVLND